MTVYSNPANANPRSYTNATPPRAADGKFVSGPVGFEWRGLSMMTSRLYAISQELGLKRQNSAKRIAAAMLVYMKANAPWKDRTGNARASLFTTVVDSPTTGQTTVYAGQGVFYGVFLEKKTYNGVSYAIVRPTLMYYRGRLKEYLE